MHMPRLMIAAASSNSGKTLITCGLMSAIKKRGMKIHSFKCGPDYIDTMFHEKVTGIPSGNLDSYFTDKETLKYIFSIGCRERDIAIIEGVMGYYDGVGGVTEKGSSFEVADMLDVPVILIISCRGMSTSLAAVIKGFISYKERSHIRGIILNNISEKMYIKLKPFIEENTGVRVYGYVPYMGELEIKSRHLGLVTPKEIPESSEKLSALLDVLEKTTDIDGLIELAYDAPEIDAAADPLDTVDTSGILKGIKIAVSRDDAFCFLYKDNINILNELGAQTVYFSPLKDETVPEGVSGLILTGGYPELYAGQLSENKSMLLSVKTLAGSGMPIIAECGGFMYLNRSMEDESQKKYDMVGITDGDAFKTTGLRRFGYVKLTALKDQLLLKKGESIRAHEFHHWDSTSCGSDCSIEKASGDDTWEGVHADMNIYAGFPHIYFYANPTVAVNFLRACSRYSCNKNR